MGFLNSFARLGRLVSGRRALRDGDLHCAAGHLHVCGFEQLEERKLMVADLHLGGTYFEGDVGDDNEPDVIQVTFKGGAPGSQLTRVVINGDKNKDGKYSAGEVFFDTAAGGLGEYKSAELKIVSAAGFTVKKFEVIDGGQQIVFDLEGFDAGEKLVFSIDVDEIQDLDPETGDPNVNAIVEGAEFQNSILTGHFTAPHYQDIEGSGLFKDTYDAKFAEIAAATGTTLDLPPDSYVPPSDEPQPNRTAGAVLKLTQIPLPITLSGHVFHDQDLDNVRDNGEQGIGAVTLTLLQWNGSAWVSTGKTANTDSTGFYKFEGILPGKYSIVETQPSGWFSVGSIPGTVDGTINGAVIDVDTLADIVLLGGEDGINYDFGEALPGSIRGRVHGDPEGDCHFGPEDFPLEGVVIELLDAQGKVIATTKTDKDGYYEFTGLRPGVYGVREQQPDGFFHGGQEIGSAGGVEAGQDLITQISIGSDTHGINYDFCEDLPNSISGRVHADPEGDCEFGPNDIPLAGVLIELLDANGDVIATTHTDADGYYQFTNLAEGTYGVREYTPLGYFDSEEEVGQVNGVTVGVLAANDLITQIVLVSDDHGVNYDFCETLPNSIRGRVHADPEGDCEFGPNDIPLEGVLIELLDTDGNVIATTRTDADGYYKFENLGAGTYGVREHTPVGYLDSEEEVGQVNGVTVGTLAGNDLITQIVLLSDDHGVNYDFCETLPNSIRGRVHADPEGDCEFGPNDIPLAGVLIELLDAEGNVIATTHTDANGYYEFINLASGTYGVREHTPPGYFDSEEEVGQVDGVTVGTLAANDLITQIVLASNDHGINYDFCETLPNSISGRVHADPEGDCEFGPNDIPLAGVLIELLDAGGNVIATAHTDAQGYYKFENLGPGTYGVRERTPPGYFDSEEEVGKVNGVTVGTLAANDLITQIVLLSDDHGVNYDFCETLPNSIRGRVHADPEGDCEFGPNDIPLAGVRIDLFDADGNLIQTTFTNADGFYEFTGLPAGSYRVVEHQPAGYFDGEEEVGQVNGVTTGQLGGNDVITNIVVLSDDHGVHYDFCENMPNSIRGRVWADPENDCLFGSKDKPLAGVKVDLLDANGNLITSTLTNEDGYYAFTGLAAGTYRVREHQPSGYFDGGDVLGTVNGTANGAIGGNDLFTEIVLLSDDHGINYDFCELPPGKISGYVFKDGPTIVLAVGQGLPPITSVRDGKRTSDDTMIGGVTLSLYDNQGNLIATTVTNSNGYYEFSGLAGGKYTVRETHPEGYIDAIDTPGTTGGLAIDPDELAEISVTVGQHSEENNFSEVQIRRVPPEFEQPGPEPTLVGLSNPAPRPIPRLVIPPYQPLPRIPYLDGSDGMGYTWHLSIIDAGYPRGAASTEVAMHMASMASAAGLTSGEWILLDADGNEVRRKAIGKKNAIPVSGDFNGDGIMEVGLYVDGEWFIDVNGDGQWDSVDVWAKLGTRDDKPVVGDWDGDGKDDIGIFGPAWARDPHAIRLDPGLPDPLNAVTGKRKNIPPLEEEATLGKRRLQLNALGKAREDLIDHVFHYGAPIDQPIAGDWTGNGLRRIGIFDDGNWYLDVDGNGRWNAGDVTAVFGQHGDVPVIGDWNGEGTENIGVYRDGTWYLDTNGNRQIDPQDRVVHLGQPGDKPVVGDFNGDGRDEVGVYRESAEAVETAAAEAEPVE